MRIDDVNKGEEKSWAQRQKATEVMAPLGKTAVSKGTTRFIGNESLKVLGSAVVSGWLIITGTLKVVGALLIEGATNFTGNLVSSGTALFTGALTSRGTTRFEGDTSQVGPLHIVGTTDINGDVTVVSPGKIRVGDLEFRPSTAGGVFGVIYAPLGVYIDANNLMLRDALSVNGETYANGPFHAQNTVFLQGVPTKSGTGAPANLLWLDPITKQVFRTI